MFDLTLKVWEYTAATGIFTHGTGSDKNFCQMRLKKASAMPHHTTNLKKPYLIALIRIL